LNNLTGFSSSVSKLLLILSEGIPMSLTMKQAWEIVELARKTFSEKTTNKIYAKSNTSRNPLPNTYSAIEVASGRMAVDIVANLERQQELTKAIARNNTAASSMKTGLRDKNEERGTPYQRGRAMMTCGVLYKSTGNCHEQSDVAAYLAISDDPTNRATTWLVELQPPGDHVFCVVDADAEPKWKKVGDMKTAIESTFFIVIDPWMKIACLAPEYPDMAAAKMNKWLARGKRIFWQGNDGNSPGFYQPGGDYVARFLDSELAFVKAV
jgi:hypothetical protein